MSDAEREIAALRQVVGAALRLAALENSPNLAARVGKLKTADDEVKLAARNLTRAVDAREPVRQPKGWNEPAEVAS